MLQVGLSLRVGVGGADGAFGREDRSRAPEHDDAATGIALDRNRLTQRLLYSVL